MTKEKADEFVDAIVCLINTKIGQALNGQEWEQIGKDVAKVMSERLSKLLESVHAG
jgi:hypothetical protein